MFCPECDGEYRAGITHCPSCDVDLVERPSEGEAEPEEHDSAPPISTSSEMADYCGFLTMEDARQARDLLRKARIASEIVLRDTPGAEGAIVEEYWLRVPTDGLSRAAAILGYEAEEEAAPAEEAEAAEAAEDAEDDDSPFSCSDCGKSVSGDETFCPHCGARFDE